MAKRKAIPQADERERATDPTGLAEQTRLAEEAIRAVAVLNVYGADLFFRLLAAARDLPAGQRYRNGHALLVEGLRAKLRLRRKGLASASLDDTLDRLKEAGEKDEKIAKETGLSLDAVRKRRSRAKERMQRGT